IRGDLTTQEFQLQPAVETDPQIALLAVTHRVPRTAWHECAIYPYCSGVWRKSRATTGKSSGKYGLEMYRPDGAQGFYVDTSFQRFAPLAIVCHPFRG
ncbi:MAG: hypothetical protein SGJ19_24270, partial [Planctomycetia bacterium]|nr:hypothetical protein [Planctomycetia bacterium]